MFKIINANCEIPSEEVMKLKLTSRGQMIDKSVAENYKIIIRNDENIQLQLKYNELSHIIECNNIDITDADEADIIAYISGKYGLTNDKLILQQLNKNNIKHYHPILDVLYERAEKYNYDLKLLLEENDGKSYIDSFLEKFGRTCDKDDSEDMKIYSREVSRMIFYGGITRLLEPGCKFDYVPIFSSVAVQGNGKSSLVRFLAVNDKYSNDLSSIDNKDSRLGVMGMFVCELSELKAFKGKDNETIKAFITCATDKYRKPYDRNVSQIPRTCILIGTTNKQEFLTDFTGNRRFLPIRFHTTPDDGVRIVSHEKEVREYILKAYVEALILYKQGETYIHIPEKYNYIIEQVKNEFNVDDSDSGDIIDYVNDHNNPKRQCGYAISALEIYCNVMHGRREDYRKDMRAHDIISTIMDTNDDFIRYKGGSGKLRFNKKISVNGVSCGSFGTQRCWVLKDAVDKNGDIKEEIMRKN